ncbi:MAG: hypothetical protein ACTSYE_01620 [Alphaproteobacteria bacterium]
MRALSLSDTVFYNLRDAYISGASLLDGPCDLVRVVAQIEGVVASGAGWRERPFRLIAWSFAGRPQPVDLRSHVSVVRDPAVTRPDHVLEYLELMRRNRFSIAGPPWRVIVINPDDGSTPAGDGPRPLSAIFMQMRHGLGDAMRALQAMGRMSAFEPEPRHADIARDLPEARLRDLPQDMTIHDSGIAVRSVPRAGIPRGADAGRQLADIAHAIVSDADLFPGARPLRGNYGRTHLVKRHGSASGVGNHIRMETISRIAPAATKRWRIPGLERAQNLPIMSWIVAMAPGPVGRLMMGIWYDNFDSIATLLPTPPKLKMGGRAVTSLFGVPPLWGPVPLMLLVLADRDAYHVTAFPGRGFCGDPTALMDRTAALLHEPA